VKTYTTSAVADLLFLGYL